MPSKDPQQEIIKRLTRLFSLQPVQQGSVETNSQQKIAGDIPQSTVRFLKERSVANRQVHAVTFQDRNGQIVNFICYVIKNEEGMWNFRGGGGGGLESDIHKAHLVHDKAWANLNGGGWPQTFYAGGYIVGNGRQIARVRLMAHNGVSLEDTVENGIVLFVTDQPVETPLQAELYDHDGQLVQSHNVF